MTETIRVEEALLTEPEYRWVKILIELSEICFRTIPDCRLTFGRNTYCFESYETVFLKLLDDSD